MSDHIFEIVLAAGGALAAAIGVLWSQVLHHGRDVKDRLRRAEDRREQEIERIITLTGKVEGLEAGQEAYKAGVDRVANEVIAEVRKIGGGRI